MKLGGDCAGCLIETVTFHQEIRCSPVRMTVEECADNSAVEDTGKGLVIRLSVPGRYNLAIVGKAANMKTFFVCRATAKTDTPRCVFFLER